MSDTAWSPTALRLLDALRGRAKYARVINAQEALSAILADTLPGETVAGRALLDQSIWPGAPKFVTGTLATSISAISNTQVHAEVLVVRSIEEAEREHARKVGERHVITALCAFVGQDMGRIELNADRFMARVRELELGPEFTTQELAGWHGLVDTNAVVHFKDLWTIDWRRETHESLVTVWVTTVLLDELDELAFEAGSRSKARRRARTFNRWLRPKIEQAMQPAGLELRQGARLRVWEPPLSARSPDGQHLDAVEALLDRGVPVHVISNDNGLVARAVARGLQVHSLSEEALVPDEEMPAEGSVGHSGR